MSELVTLRPDVETDLADDSDLTFVNPATDEHAISDVTLGTETLGTRRVEYVQLRWRHSRTGSGSHQVSGWLRIPNVGTFPATQVNSGATITDSSDAKRALDPIGSGWDQTDIDGLQANFAWLSTGTGGTNLSLYEVHVDLALNRVPVVSGVTVDDATSTQPTISWTFTDADGDPQERCQLKVYKLADTPSPDPDVDEAHYDSGEVLSSVLRELQCEEELDEDGDYRFFVRASQPWSTGVFWSAWASVDEEIIAVRPDAPALAVVAEEHHGRLKVTVSTIDADAELVTVEFSDDETTWVAVRDARNVAVSGSSMTFYDYEAPPESVRHYRARVIDTTGVHASSQNSTVRSGEWHTEGFWLKDPIDPARNMLVTVDGDGELAPTEREPHGVFDPLGDDERAVVVTAGYRGDEGELPLLVLDSTEYATLKTLTTSGRTLLLQDLWGRQWYVHLGQSRRWRTVRGGDPEGLFLAQHMHQVTLPWVEVRRP